MDDGSSSGTARADGLLVVLAAPLVVALVGAAAAVVMADRERRNAAAVALSVGATPPQLVGAAVGQVLVVIATSTALGVVAVGVTVLTAAWAVGPDAAAAAARAAVLGIGGTAGVCFLVQAGAVAAATALSLRRDGRGRS
ncbi:hypothetical protein [Cellulosimicrobium sp. CUA-896]|uniref:hypothetical protein n=1 Tax=Cellulosimicrobium sp. CUA-896 TaxID=1517881 RepID=UPI0011151329|nr:hypothetical protein [Cellulosimicrobium sp. CUA-896]